MEIRTNVALYRHEIVLKKCKKNKIKTKRFCSVHSTSALYRYFVKYFYYSTGGVPFPIE